MNLDSGTKSYQQSLYSSLLHTHRFKKKKSLALLDKWVKLLILFNPDPLAHFLYNNGGGKVHKAPLLHTEIDLRESSCVIEIQTELTSFFMKHHVNIKE